jgi:hypothetical protein
MCTLKSKVLILISALMINHPAYSHRCGSGELESSQRESDLISFSPVTLETGKFFSVTFPQEFNDKQYETVGLKFLREDESFVFSAQLQPEIDVRNDPLGQVRVKLLISKEIEYRVYLRVGFGGCLFLGKTLRPHNKSLSTDASDTGAG